MRKFIKWALIVVASTVALLVVLCISMSDTRRFFLLQATNAARAGTWEDDPKNWFRAFNEEPPADVSVVRSKYWRSNHFTDEFVYYFEVQASAAWRDAFLKKRNVELISPPAAATYRMNNHSDLAPDWFVPGPAEKYDVWDKAGHCGSIWMDKTNGHVFFYDQQV